VVGDAWLQRDETTGVNAQRLSNAELEVVDGAAGVDEAEAVALEFLHDEALAAEQPDAELLLERNPNRDTASRAQERVLLADQVAAEQLEIHWNDLAGVRRAKRHT